MKTMQIYEPAMCCPTGLCGVNVDPELIRISANINNLRAHKINVMRYNLNSAPQAFVKSAVVSAEIKANGMSNLPLIVVDDEIVIKKRYPTDKEFCELLNVPCEYVSADPDCCNADGDCCKK